jgi:hypothetical protein
MTVRHVTAIALKVSAHPVNLTTVAPAMTALAHPATSTHRAHHVATMTTSNPAPMHTWAPKAA